MSDPESNNLSAFEMTVYYQTHATEERTEILVYDVGSLLVAAGGNLGLFMGFSVLSILLAITRHFIKR
jgi:hypothetical protein